VIYVRQRAKEPGRRPACAPTSPGPATTGPSWGCSTPCSADIETIVVANEKEALLLENTLIKRHQPRFNVKLRDDKAFLLLRVDLDRPFPRVELVRRIAEDHARYFGPFPGAHTARELQRLVTRHFRLCSCSPAVLARRSRPCLQHAMGRCSGACAGLIGPEE